MPSSEPKDPSSPFRGITTAWGFMDVLADGMSYHEDAPAEALARAMDHARDGLDEWDGASFDGGGAAGSVVTNNININAPTTPMTERDIGLELRRSGVIGR